MDVLKSLIIIAVGLACVHCQNTNPASNQNARTLATGGTEFVVTGGGNQPPGGSGSLLDIALASFGTSSGGPANPPQPADPNQPPQTPPAGSGNFVDAVNNLLSTGTSQMDPNVLTNLGLPTEQQNTQNTGTQPIDPPFQQSNPGPMPPNEPSLNTGLIGVPFRDPNSVPMSDPNAGPVPGPVASSPGGDPNAIGGGLVLQVDPQSGMNRGPVYRGDTAAVQYSSAGSIPQALFDPNTARNVLDRNAPLPGGSVFELTGQTEPGMSQPGIYPTMSTGGNTMMPQGGPNAGGPLGSNSGGAGGPYSTNSGGAGEPYSTNSGGAGGPYSTNSGSAGGPLGANSGGAGGPYNTNSGSAGVPLSLGSAGGPYNTNSGSAGGPYSTNIGSAGGPPNTVSGGAGGPLSTVNGGAGGPLSTVNGGAGGPLGMVNGGAGGPLSTVNGGAGGLTGAVFGATGTKPVNSPLYGNSGIGGNPGAPPSGGILSTLKNNGMPGAGMPSGPLAAMKAGVGTHTKQPAQDNGMMNMLIMSMLMGGGEMNPALLMMAMGSMGGGGGGGGMMSALPLIMSMSGM